MMQKNIIVPKTARYFITGDITDAIEQIWFVCHGYGQLASYFLKNFDVLNDGKTLIVAPEGLHRFYWGGFSGRVVASWMTKEDRKEDIKDYVNYLEIVYTEVLSQFDPELFRTKKITINVLGFSQGTATVCRWLANNRSVADHLVLWAGAFPADMDLQLNKKIFDAIPTVVVIGDQDEFINEAEVEKHEAILKSNGIKYELMRFIGKHEIHAATLMELSDKLQAAPIKKS